MFRPEGNPIRFCIPAFSATSNALPGSVTRTRNCSLLSVARCPIGADFFLRGHGSQVHYQHNRSIVGITSTTHNSGALGQVQGDGTRNVTETIGPSIDGGSSGIVYRNGQSGYMLPSAAHYATAFHHIDISRVVPTANENRPVNTAVRFLVRARP